jgi:non-specific serine/threonine protein kinase
MRDFALTTENAAAVAELCRALDGIPLAVELAAPRLKIFSPAGLAARLQRRLPLLEGDQLDRPARHRTMRAALAWSYELLTPGEQSVLRRIAVFRGHFSAGGARAVALDAHAGEGVHVLPVLAVLVDHNLLRVDDAGAEPYFELPQLIREYAYEQLVATEGLDAVYLHLARYCLETAGLVRLAQAPAERRPIMDRLERESATFDVLLGWTLESGRIEFGLRITYALRVFWYLRGSCAEGLKWSSAFIAAAQREPGGLPAEVLANAYRQRMSLGVTAGDFDSAEHAATRALELTESTGDQTAMAFIFNVAGFIASQRGDYARARGLFEDGLRLRRDAGDAHDIGNSLRDLGRSLADSGDAEAGAALLEESLLFFQRVEGALGAGEALRILGVIAARRGDDERAERLAREALTFGAAHGHALRRGADPEAARFFGHALAALERASFADIPEVLDGLAACAQARQRSRDAARLLGGAASLRARMKKQIVPADLAAYETLVAAVTNALSPYVFDAEWTIGGTLSYEELRSIAHTLIDEGTRI